MRKALLRVEEQKGANNKIEKVMKIASFVRLQEKYVAYI